MFDVKRVSNTIKTKRIEKNMTQGDLADKLFVSFQAVSNWERGNAMPDISKLEDLCTVLEISVDELLGIGVEGKVQRAKPVKVNKREIYEVHLGGSPEGLKKFEKNTEEHAAKFASEILSQVSDTLSSVFDKEENEKIKLKETEETQEDFVASCLEKEDFDRLFEKSEELSEENLSLIVDYLINTGKTDILSQIYEFLPENLLCEIAKFLIETGADEEEIAKVYDYI